MAFIKTILDNGTPTGQSDANSSGSDNDANHARLSLTRDDEDDDKTNKKDEKDEKDDETSKSHQSSDEEANYSSFSESDDEKEENKKGKRLRRKSDSVSSNYSSEERRKVRRKPPIGHRTQPWHDSEPQSHQDMLQRKFQELRGLLTDHNSSKVDKHLLKKTRALMKHYHVSQAGLLPGPGITGSRSPRSEKRAQWARSSVAWQEGTEYTNSASPVTGEEYILIDGTGDEVKTRRVKFSNIETESIPDGDPAFKALGSLGLPIPVAPSAPRPTSGWNRRSRPRRKAASAERPRTTKQERSKRRSATRSPSVESHSRSRSSSSRSRSRSQSRSQSRARSESSKQEAEKLKKTDHRLKDTDNHVLQEWLKRKDKELKAKKKEERKQKKEQREKKRREFEEKEKMKEKSEEAVRMWYVKKEEEQRLLQKRERVRRPLQKNEFSYSLELITFARSPEGDTEDHHASNPDLSSRDKTSGAPFVSSGKAKRKARSRAKSAKVRSSHVDEKSDADDVKEDRKSYDQWLEDKREQEIEEKETAEEEGTQKQHDDLPAEDAEKAEGGEMDEEIAADGNEKKSEDVKSDVQETEDVKPDMDDEELLTDVGQRRDVNMNIQRKDSDSFDPYDKPKDYTLDAETRRNFIQFSDSLELDETEPPTKLESSPSFRLPSPPLHSFSPVPTREKSLEENPIVDPEVGDPQASVAPHPPPPDLPRSAAYRRVRRDQGTWDADNVWTQVNQEAEEKFREKRINENQQETEEMELTEGSPNADEPELVEEERQPEKLEDDNDQNSHENEDFVREEAASETNESVIEKSEENVEFENPIVNEDELLQDRRSLDGNEERGMVEDSLEIERTVKDDLKKDTDVDGVGDADVDVDEADQGFPASVKNESHTMEAKKGTDEESELLVKPEDSESVLLGDEYGAPILGALHLNPIREETEVDDEVSGDIAKEDGDDKDNAESVNQSQNQSESVTEDKTGTTFLTTGEERDY